MSDGKTIGYSRGDVEISKRIFKKVGDRSREVTLEARGDWGKTPALAEFQDLFVAVVNRVGKVMEATGEMGERMARSVEATFADLEAVDAEHAKLAERIMKELDESAARSMGAGDQLSEIANAVAPSPPAAPPNAAAPKTADEINAIMGGASPTAPAGGK